MPFSGPETAATRLMPLLPAEHSCQGQHRTQPASAFPRAEAGKEGTGEAMTRSASFPQNDTQTLAPVPWEQSCSLPAGRGCGAEVLPAPGLLLLLLLLLSQLFRGQTVPHSGNSGLLGSSAAQQLQNTRGFCEERAERLQLQGGRSPELPEELLSLPSPRLHSSGALAATQISRFLSTWLFWVTWPHKQFVPTRVLPHRQPENKYLGCQNQQCPNPQLPPPFCHSISDGVASSPWSESSYFSGASVSNRKKSRLMVNTRQMCSDSASKLHFRDPTEQSAALQTHHCLPLCQLLHCLM